MNWSFKPCSAITTTTSPGSWDVQNHNFSALVDRLTSLPDDVLIRILSLLPTKDAAATCVLSKKLRCVFPYIVSLDFNVSPINLCLGHPYAIERYPTFVKFVDSVLRTYKSKYLTRFRLQVGSNNYKNFYLGDWISSCDQGCFPDLNYTCLDAWISFPLTRCGLRELDLCILVRKPGDAQLPPAIFTCETLEVLKLEVNLCLDEVITMPSYCLPNLKLLLMSVSIVSDDDFLPRLVSSCPLLEDLTFEAFTSHAHHTTVFSTSLRRLCLRMHKLDRFMLDNTDLVLIDTPNLEYLDYTDNVAVQYTIPTMHRLVEAELMILHIIQFGNFEVTIQNILGLIRACSHVQRLSLLGFIVRVLGFVGEVLEDQLPVFANVKQLELRCGLENFYWDKLILPFLNHSPVLETLVFPEGLTVYYDDGDDYSFESDRLELEREFFTAAHEIPSGIISKE
ncbi:hypothetical protein RDABS01_033968 [Bienertia sinuspersici]